MKQIYLLLSLIIFSSLSISANEKKALVEIFTNSGCAACVPAHAALDNYLQGANGDEIEYIYYHIEWPIPDDKLYTDNKGDSQSKNSFYGPYFSAPQAFFNGKHVENSYTQWEGEIDKIIQNEKSFNLLLSGSKKNTSFTINAEITKIKELGYSDLTVNYVVVENLVYAGTNGILNHKHVMRKIYNPKGTSFTANLNESVEQSAVIALNSSWNTDNLKIVVFLQDKSTKEVYQTASIDFADFTPTSISVEETIPEKFELIQNYPNPFNPTTTIKYNIPNTQTQNFTSFQLLDVTLIVYDILGREVATLVNKQQKPGYYKIHFDANNLTTGIYFYSIKAGTFYQTKKMTLIK